MTSETETETERKPKGELALQTLAMPKDTNANGDIFGGWLVSAMDLAAGIVSKKTSKGRSATVAIQNVEFIKPVSVGSTVTCYAYVTKTGRTSMHIAVEVWSSIQAIGDEVIIVAQGLFVFVAIDDEGKPRVIAA